MKNLKIFLFFLLVPSLFVQLVVNGQETTTNPKDATGSTSTTQGSTGSTSATTSRPTTTTSSTGTPTGSTGTTSTSTATGLSPFDAKAFVLNNLKATSFPTSMTPVQREALTLSMTQKVGDAKRKDNTVPNTTLVEIITTTLNEVVTAFTSSNSAPAPASSEGTTGNTEPLFLFHSSALPRTLDQHVIFALAIKIAQRSDLKLISSSGFAVTWTCNSTSFFGDAGSYSSAEGHLIIDVSTRVKAGDVINFTATITNLTSNTVIKLSKLILFNGNLPSLKYQSQTDESTTQENTFGVKRVVTFTLENTPTFLDSTNKIVVKTKSLSDYYNTAIKVEKTLAQTFTLSFIQTPKASDVEVIVSIKGSPKLFSVVFTLNPSTDTKISTPKEVDLTKITPTGENLGDVSTLISVKIGSRMAASNGTNTTSNSSSKDPKSACAAKGGVWVTSTKRIGFEGYCNRTFESADTKQVQSLADNTLTLFNTNSSTFSSNDKLGFIKSIGASRKDGIPLASSTVTMALDGLSTLAKNFSSTIALSFTASNVGGMTVGSESNTGDLRTSMQGILTARRDIIISDAETISNNETNSTTLETAKTNQRKSLAILDEVLSAFATARSAVAGSLTVSSGDDTLFSQDLCIKNYANLSDADWISLKIDPKAGATNESELTTTTKFGFHIAKKTLQNIITTKTDGTVNCINVGGIKTNKATGAAGHNGVEKMSNEIIGFKILDATGNKIDVTGNTLYLELPCKEFKPETFNLTSNKTLNVKYLSTTSEIPADAGTLVKLGDDNTTCIFSVNHLSSYALSNDSYDGNGTVIASAIRMEIKSLIAAMIVFMGALFLN